MRDGVPPGIVIILCAMCGTFGLLLGLSEGVDRTRREAVKVGVATWTNTPEGDAQFKWKVEAEKKP